MEQATIRTAYYVRMEWGTHRTWVEVNNEDFDRWMSELGKEFQLRTDDNALVYDDEWRQEQTVYTLDDYLGNAVMVGVRTVTYDPWNGGQ